MSAGCSVTAIDERNEFISGPRWRVRTNRGQRRWAAGMSFTLITIVGAAAMVGAMAVLALLDAPWWIVAAPWYVPTVGVALWTLLRPHPAIVGDENDDSWSGYAVRLVMVGEDTANPVPMRAAAALVLGGPVGWALGVLLVLELLGLV